MVRQHEAHVEHRHQRLAAGQQLGVVERAQQAHGLGKRFRIVVLKGRRLHRWDPSIGNRRDREQRQPEQSDAPRRSFSACSPCCSRCRNRRGRRAGRRLLSRQDRDPDRRLQRRRRLRHLCPHPGAAHGQAHPRQSHHRGAEHAGRGLAARRQLCSTTSRRRTAPTIGMFSRGIAMEPLIGGSQRRSSTRPSSSGSAAAPNEASVFVIWHTAPVKTWADMLHQALHRRRRRLRLRPRHLCAAAEERVRRQAAS